MKKRSRLPIFIFRFLMISGIVLNVLWILFLLWIFYTALF